MGVSCAMCFCPLSVGPRGVALLSLRVSPLCLTGVYGLALGSCFTQIFFPFQNNLMKHNVYLDGGLQNIEFNDNGVDKSVGVIDPGDYTFTPDRQETIQCLTGLLTINNNQCFPGQKAIIEKSIPFTISTKETSSYICTYR